MKIGLFSNAGAAEQGGGAAYITAIGVALARRHDVDLHYAAAADAAQMQRLLPRYGTLPRIRQEPARSSAWLIGEWQRALGDLAYDAIALQATYVPRMTFCRDAYLVCEFPFARALPLDDRIRLASFKAIIANSAYTARWIERRWRRRAIVLHPPVVPVAPGPKRPFILAAGRFIGGGRSKRQLDLVAIFRQLCDAGLHGWELHLAGFAQDAVYARQVVAEAEGLPVRFHFDIERQELERLYGVSAIFWHAVGAGVDAEREPERMEHFGMVTAEAMSAGCVPVVIDRGGQPEIVGMEGAGVMWETFDECRAATWALIHDDTRRQRMAQLASERAARFAFPAFAEQLDRIIEAV